MYVSQKNRIKIYQMYDGKCAYSGTDLLNDWQIDHIDPVLRKCGLNSVTYPELHTFENMVPCQRIINHYKGSLSLSDFRDWFLGGLHKRLAKLPKNPRTEKSIRKKAYLLEVASFFGITPSQPFSGVFYFEQLETKSSKYSSQNT